MTKINDTKELIKKYTIDDTATLRPNLTKEQLLEIKNQLEELHKEDGFCWLQGQRKSDCYLWEVDSRLKEINQITQKNYTYNFEFNNLKIEAEKPVEPIAYNEPVFVPNETEADINISSTNDQDAEDYTWQIEEYEKEERKKFNEIREESQREENIEWGIISTSEIFNTQETDNYETKLKRLENLILDLSLRVKELESKQLAQVAQVVQAPK